MIKKSLHQQRLKILWFCWGYWPLLFVTSLPAQKRFEFLYKFLRIDWSIEHSHKADEILNVVQSIARHPVYKDEIVLEAGCWKGGSTAKLSIFCKFFGYTLHVYDSFQGVEPVQEGGYNFSGQYSAGEAEVRENLNNYGAGDICVFHKGWFAETLKPECVKSKIRAVYIDCDLAKGTEEVLRGVLPWLVEDCHVFTQDYHIISVKQLLHNQTTWERLGVPGPTIIPLCHNLAVMKFYR